MPSPMTSALAAGHSFTAPRAPEHAAFQSCRRDSGVKRDALDPGGRVGRRRRASGPAGKDAACRDRRDSADGSAAPSSMFGRQSAPDRSCGARRGTGRRACRRSAAPAPTAAWRSRTCAHYPSFAARGEIGPIPVREQFDRFVAISSFDHHQPVDRVAVRAAAEAVEMIVVDVAARGAVVVKRTADFAVDQRVRQSDGERDFVSRPACGSSIGACATAM